MNLRIFESVLEEDQGLLLARINSWKLNCHSNNRRLVIITGTFKVCPSYTTSINLGCTISVVELELDDVDQDPHLACEVDVTESQRHG